MALEDKIPRLAYFQSRLPSPEQKIVQLEVDGQPYLRAGNCFHGEILIEFIIECRQEEEGLLSDDEISHAYELGSAPKEGERYRAVGMGKVELNLAAKKALFFGSSDMYEIGINLEHLQRIAAYFPEWTFQVKEENE